MTISKSWFSYLTRVFALFLCSALLLSFVSCSDSSTSQDPKVKIILDANGGSFSETTGKTETTKTLLIKKNQTSKLSTADELGLSRENHNFTGWAKSQQGTVEYNDGADITSSTDLTLYAQWEAVNTTYTVKHLLQNLQDDEYTEDSTEQESGKSGTKTSAAAKSYEGFTAKSFAQATIQADGSTVVEIYYDRKTYTVSYSSTYGEPPASKPVKYGYILNAADLPALTQTNYSFKGWVYENTTIEAGYIVKKAITLTAQWDEIIATYTVKHLLQNLQDDNYTEDSTEQKSGKSGTQTVASAKTYEGFSAKTFAQATIQADGSTVVEIYYDRNTYTLSYSSTYAEPPASKPVKYEYVLTAEDLPVLSETGYDFNGWFFDGASIVAGYIIKTDITLTAQWNEIIATYTVKHLLQNLQDDSYTEKATEQKSGKSGTQTASAAKSYEGFTVKTFAQKTIQADGSTVVEIYYDRNTYTLSYSSTYGDPPVSKTVRYGYVLTAADLPDLTQTNYSFKGWFFDGASIEAGYTVKADITLTAQWKGNYIVTKENFSAVIAALTEDSTIVLTGELTASDLTTLKTAIKNSTYNVNLDLSQTTGLTSIPGSALSSCTKLSGITIPDSVTSIGDNAFLGCTSLEDITVDSNNPNYSSIDGILFNKDATAIITYPAGKQSAAYTIPDSVTYIGTSTFYGCTSLSSVNIPDSVTYIGAGAFFGCTSLSSVTIPNSITSIDNNAFYSCNSLSSVTIPDSVTSISYYAFYGCSALSSITIPDSVTFIDKNTFDGCTSLSSVSIGDSVTSIGVSVFNGCTSLTTITVNSNNANYSSIDGVLFNKDVTAIITYPAGKQSAAYTLPDSVTSIGACAFYSCTSLSSVTIPDSVTTIENSAFHGCTLLSSVTIPDSVTSIGNAAFGGCTALTSLTFANTTTWYRTNSSTNWKKKTNGTLTDLSDPATNATYFKSTYKNYYWYKLDE